MRLFGLIGYPLSHSFSKNYFSEKFFSEGIEDCQYELFPLQNINELPALLAANPFLKGLNITIPYKRDVLTYLADCKIPPGLDACNCIAIENGHLTGFNTDVVGFEKSFRSKWNQNQQTALILGNGGAAAAVKYVFEKLGIKYKVVGRRLKDGIQLTYDEITPSIIREHAIIINTTPLGTFPKIEEYPLLPYHALSKSNYLFDLVYNPAKTSFLKQGAQMGATVQNGYDMLIYQAEEAWRIWNV